MKAMSDKGNEEREIVPWDNEVKPKVTVQWVGTGCTLLETFWSKQLRG